MAGRYSKPIRVAVTTIAVVCGIVVVLYGGAQMWYRCEYPYAWSHSCIKCLGGSLDQYAMAHSGKYPAGGPTPEASLSLLYGNEYSVGAELLRGKTVPVEVTQKALDEDGRLGPDSCGWHYVEGLTMRDDPRVAILWDKVGLDHNGRRLRGGGHEVWFLGGRAEYVSDADWLEFLKQQEALLAARPSTAREGIPALTAKVRLPSGEIVDRYDAVCWIDQETKYESGSGSGSSGGGPLQPSHLQWWHLYPENGTMALTLRLGQWTSKPVEVKIANGVASPGSIVFELAEDRSKQP